MHNLPYVVAIVIFCIGLYMIITEDSVMKKIIGLTIFQSSILIFFIALGKIRFGIVPVSKCEVTPCDIIYSNPLPHVLMLTAIVVGIATMAVAISFCILVQKKFGTLNSTEILGRAEEE
ncbi:MAG: cation:proton antiporter subunit C [Alphaproteobacteria bacterium]|nr:cation:proton antiporter subunit C [Alphaproteobacteria bacterium]OJV14257.1 MAG: hypothetical protein BGO27_01990 [Alphaproteobacteria bacterium 33-17]